MVAALVLGASAGQGWTQIGELTLALVLSAAIGLEGEIRGKSAGLRTHTIIGFAAALIVLVSKYGFSDVLGDHVDLDPSRVAAQIVSGVGFIGGGLIFVRRDAVRGLTTAASVWLTTAVGMAAGAGMPILACLTTVGFFGILFGLSPLAHKLSGPSAGPLQLQITYLDGRGLLREVLELCTRAGWTVADLTTRRSADEPAGLEVGRNDGRDHPGRGGEESGSTVTVLVGLRGRGAATPLMAELGDLRGVVRVTNQAPEEDD